MFRKIKKYKGRIFLFIAMLIALYTGFYRVSHPTIVYHTYEKSGYLGKVSEIDGCIYKLYIYNHTAQYRLPHIKDWKDEDEVAIFLYNYTELFTRKNVDFWILDIYLDENGKYKSHSCNYNIMKQFSNVKFMYPIWGMLALLLISIYLYIRNKISVTIFWLFVFIIVYSSPFILGILSLFF